VAGVDRVAASGPASPGRSPRNLFVGRRPA